MPIKINLLPRKGARELLQERWLRRATRGSYLVALSYVVILGLVFGVRLYWGGIKSRLDDQVGAVRQTVAGLAQIESQQLLVKSKLSQAGVIVNTQLPWTEVLGEVMELVPNPGSVSRVELDRQGALTVGMQTRNLQELALSANALVALGQTRQFVKDIQLENVDKNNSGVYGLTIKFTTK